MSLFKDKIVELNVSETYLSADVIVKGDISVNGQITVDGCVNGNISEAKFVIVGKNGKVSGNISCEKCKIEGEVRGNVYALENLQICESGLLNGDIKTSSVDIEHGARFNGKCVMESLAK